ncbi:TatD family deoxyribonuclease [Deferribacter autotrophicus]|uniref:TatD family deoxyribonuclease n=1 Tax=Deferribacter autotrophicus TaxID=500465 RepID=A0A5A8F1S2_9BACT|nr:TatD family hydrolase [Deferribacter autotrophicus]KAA0257681.1 TatD family deoxyribonuclease [Deferribacter autotrophicus]
MSDLETSIEQLKKEGLFFTDTHAHIHFEPLGSNLDKVIENCKKNCIGRIINIGINLEDSKKALSVAKQYPFIYAAVGVHPHDSENFKIKDLGYFEELIQDEKVLAIGEIGLDYYRNYAPADIQKDVFRIFLDLALSLDKPIVIHNRESSEDIVKILNEMNSNGKLKGIIHCFNGDRTILKWALDNGFLISFAGNVTYKKAVEIRDAAKDVPFDRVLVETDSPYLAPVPKRGKTNEPAYAIYTAKFLADFYGVTLIDLAKITEENISKLFGKLNVL